ncbi:hypothetical protein VNO78_18275 [Psophocarpus tetragonolobus]|uniref:Uncharacterized protein n=1 Tax=Psophocarpus tetragonolobus TaxID=3891 RepID=A0AAN9XLW7_PSOTE
MASRGLADGSAAGATRKGIEVNLAEFMKLKRLTFSGSNIAPPRIFLLMVALHDGVGEKRSDGGGATLKEDKSWFVETYHMERNL